MFLFQVSYYALNKFRLANFLIENTRLYNELFIRKEKMYTLDDVYEQIEHVANTVSVIIVQILYTYVHIAMYVFIHL